MDITLKGNNGEKVVIPIEDLIQKYWSDENSKPNRIEMSATVKDETILAAMTICDEKEENYLSVDLESRNEKFDTEALWCSLEAPNTLNPFVTGYLYSGNNETESDDWLLRIVDGYRAADDDSPRIVFANKRTVSVQDFCEESEGENKYRIFVPCGESKAAAAANRLKMPFIDKSFVLLDDYSVNLHDWKEKGGSGIKLRNGINGNIGTWKGPSVSRFNTPETLATLICQAAKIRANA